MFLVHPDYLIGEAPLPGIAIRAYAQVLCEDLAQRIGVPAPRIIVADGQAIVSCSMMFACANRQSTDGRVGRAKAIWRWQRARSMRCNCNSSSGTCWRIASMR